MNIIEVRGILKLKSVCILFLLSLVYGCASYQLDEAQHSIRSSFASQNYEKTIKLLEKFDQKNIYKNKDRVLFNLEMGMASHFNAKYDSSSVYFTRAEDEIEQIYSKSITKGIKSFLFTNDNALEYDGEDYENIYLNMFKSINYLHRDNRQDALVEARRMSYKLSHLEIKYKGLAAALSKTDTLHKTQWKSGKTNVQNSALSHYLSAILYAKTNKPDDARIEYEKMLEAFNDQPVIYRFQPSGNTVFARIKDQDQYNVLVTGFSGRAPIKIQHDVRLYLDQEDLYLKFSLPSLHLYHTMVNRVEAVFDDTLSVSIPMIEEMDVVAKEVYKVKEPIIYARAFTRSFVKAIGTNLASKAVKKKDKDLGILLNILGKVGQEFSEKADLRGWQTMPGKSYANVVKLPAGKHHCTMRYLDERSELLYSKDIVFTVSSDQDLQVIESLYWN